MSPVKVFGSAALLVCLEEVGAEYEVIDVDLHAKEHKGPEHLPRNVAIGESVGKPRKVLGVYEARLGKRRYLAGDAISLADLRHFPHTHYVMGMSYVAVFDELPGVRAWWQDLMAHLAVRKVTTMMDGCSG
nr:unnamed protein product [Digitaria exilis]